MKRFGKYLVGTTITLLTGMLTALARLATVQTAFNVPSNPTRRESDDQGWLHGSRVTVSTYAKLPPPEYMWPVST